MPGVVFLYLEGSVCYALQLVVGQDEVPQVHQALEVGVVQGREAVGVQLESVEVLEVGEGVRPDLTDGVSAQGQMDLGNEEEIKGRLQTQLLHSVYFRVKTFSSYSS